MVEAHLFQEQTKIVIRISPKRRYSSSQCEAAMNGLPGYWLMALDEVAALRRACLALPYAIWASKYFATLLRLQHHKMLPSRGLRWSSQTVGIGRRRLEQVSTRHVWAPVSRISPIADSSSSPPPLYKMPPLDPIRSFPREAHRLQEYTQNLPSRERIF